MDVTDWISGIAGEYAKLYLGLAFAFFVSWFGSRLKPVVRGRRH